MKLDVVTREELNAMASAFEKRIAQLENQGARTLVPVTEAATRLGVSTRTIKRRYQTVAKGRRRYVKSSDLEA